jgi:hypothetical protein
MAPGNRYYESQWRRDSAGMPGASRLSGMGGPSQPEADAWGRYHGPHMLCNERLALQHMLL